MRCWSNRSEHEIAPNLPFCLNQQSDVSSAVLRLTTRCCQDARPPERTVSELMRHWSNCSEDLPQLSTAWRHLRRSTRVMPVSDDIPNEFVTDEHVSPVIDT